MSVVRCQVEVSAKDRSLIQGSSAACGVYEHDLETSTIRRSRPARTVEPQRQECVYSITEEFNFTIKLRTF